MDKKREDKTRASDNPETKPLTVPVGGLTRESDLSSGLFSFRLKEAKGSESVLHLAGRAGLSEGVIRQYLKQESDPSRVSLIRLARALGVNLAWLASGEGPIKTDPQVADERATYTAPARDSVVDLEWLQEVLRAVKTLLEMRGVTLSPEDEARLVTYDASRVKGLIEKNDLVGLLDLIY